MAQCSSPPAACGYLWVKEGPAPTLGQAAGQRCPCSSPSQELSGLHPTFPPSSPAHFKPGKDIFTDENPGNRAGHHLHETKPRFWSDGEQQVRGLRALHSDGRKGRAPTFRTHISPPAGQSSPALLLAVLLGEERSALLMAMNSSGLFIQPSSACWLQPQPAPAHGMTAPGNNARPGDGPLRPGTPRDPSGAAALSSSEHPLPPAERDKPGPAKQCHPS